MMGNLVALVVCNTYIREGETVGLEKKNTAGSENGLLK